MNDNPGQMTAEYAALVRLAKASNALSKAQDEFHKAHDAAWHAARVEGWEDARIERAIGLAQDGIMIAGQVP